MAEVITGLNLDVHSVFKTRKDIAGNSLDKEVDFFDLLAFLEDILEFLSILRLKKRTYPGDEALLLILKEVNRDVDVLMYLHGKVKPQLVR